MKKRTLSRRTGAPLARPVPEPRSPIEKAVDNVIASRSAVNMVPIPALPVERKGADGSVEIRVPVGDDSPHVLVRNAQGNWHPMVLAPGRWMLHRAPLVATELWTPDKPLPVKPQ